VTPAIGGARHTIALSHRSGRRLLHGRQEAARTIRVNDPRGTQRPASKDDVMEPRIDLMTNEIGAKIAKRFYNVSLVIEQSSLPKATQELVMLRTSQINGCGFCLDFHTKEAAAAGQSAVRLHLVAAWRETTVFTEAERAALALAEEGTRLADAHHGVSDETWAEVRKHYDEDQTVALISLVAMVNAANRLGVIARRQGGSYEPGMFTSMAS
jgi:AhpD family alkylhydroperoxidase